MSTVVAKSNENEINCNNEQKITEGLVTITSKGNVFYNPVQEFNRDLSISVLSVFSQENLEKVSSKNDENSPEFSEENRLNALIEKTGIVYENGITILEALSATGLRSIRYAKEIPGVKKIIANDLSLKAVENITHNVNSNDVKDIVNTSHSDAVMLMYSYQQKKEFHAIDLDPYGCPAKFLDAAVQAVKDDGLLLVTATDMAVLAGNCPEVCYSKYGSISLKIKACHEMAIRILLQSIESHANRYGRYIEPLLSISADFYIRVFVKIRTGILKCKYTLSKLSMVYHCTGCGSFTLQPLGIIKSQTQKNVKLGLPTGPAVNPNCEHCNNRHHMGGPIWSAPIHCKEFVHKVLETAPKRLGTWKRIHGMLTVIAEELNTVPLYYTLENLAATIHCDTPSMQIVRSAILNAGYEVSYSHVHKTSIKTNAPGTFIWDIMRQWEKTHPVKRERFGKGGPGLHILNKPITHEINFDLHPDANPLSKKMGFVRFQANPMANWGPGTRATTMVGNVTSKSKKNQGKKKRKREGSADSTSVEEKKMDIVQ